MSDDDACPRPRFCTEHFDLTADDSQDEGLADDMHGCELACPCRTATPHRVMIGYTARRWPVRRRKTCDVRNRGGRCKSWAAGSVSLWSGPTTLKPKGLPERETT